MPLVLLVIGVVIMVTAFRGTTGKLGSLLKGDLTGPQNFTIWLLAIAFIGAFSYVPGVKPVANAFFALLIIVILLAHQNNGQGGFFGQLSAALNKTSTVTPVTHTYSNLGATQ